MSARRVEVEPDVAANHGRLPAHLRLSAAPA